MTDRTDVSGPGATVSSAGLPPGGSRRQDPREAGAGLEPAHGQDSVAFRARRVRARVPFDVGEHVVVVGCGPVAARFVDDVLPLVERGLLRVTVLGAEPHMAYNRNLRAFRMAVAGSLVGGPWDGLQIVTKGGLVGDARTTIACLDHLRGQADAHRRQVTAVESREHH